MKKRSGPGLAIFETFKTMPDRLTGEARRQRTIIVLLATQHGPAERTRTGISQRMAEGGGVPWKNIYSGIFRDIEDVLLPLGLVREDGRLPLSRGPKALQESGVPYYSLTRRGIMVSVALDELGDRRAQLDVLLDGAESDGERDAASALKKIAAASEHLAYYMIRSHVRAYCAGEMQDLLPLDTAAMARTSDESTRILAGFLDGFLAAPKQDRKSMTDFMGELWRAEKPDKH